MMVVAISEAGSSNYITGTLFTPSQPYLKVSFMYNESIQNIMPANLTFARIKYDQVVETLGAEETDKNISLITEGNDAGIILLPVKFTVRPLTTTLAVEEVLAPRFLISFKSVIELPDVIVIPLVVK